MVHIIRVMQCRPKRTILRGYFQLWLTIEMVSRIKNKEVNSMLIMETATELRVFVADILSNNKKNQRSYQIRTGMHIALSVLCKCFIIKLSA